MGSYRDVTRDGRKYSGDKFLELHRHHARTIHQGYPTKTSSAEQQPLRREGQQHGQRSRQQESAVRAQRPAGPGYRSDFSGHRNNTRDNFQAVDQTSTVTEILNPFVAAEGELLSLSQHRNWEGLLVQSCKVIPHTAVDSAIFNQKTLHLQEHVVIACFVGGNIEDSAVNIWLDDLGRHISPHLITLDKPAGQGFHYVKFDHIAAVGKATGLLLHRFPGGSAAYQPWQPSFNPKSPSGTFFPHWLSLVPLPLEYHSLLADLAGQLGQILAFDIPDPAFSTHKFCVALDLSQGWTSSLKILDPFGGLVVIDMEYEGRQLQCRGCHSPSHNLDHCPLVNPAPTASAPVAPLQPKRQNLHPNPPVHGKGPPVNTEGHHPNNRATSKYGGKHRYARHSYRNSPQSRPKPTPDADGFTPVHH